MKALYKAILISLGLWLVVPVSASAASDDDVTIQMLEPGDDVADVMENIDLPEHDDVDEIKDSHEDVKDDDGKDDDIGDESKEDDIGDDRDDHPEPLEDHNEDQEPPEDVTTN